MDWKPTEMMEAISGLAGEVLATGTWDDVVAAGLLEVEDVLDVSALLVEAGRAGARLPLLPTLVLGGPAAGDGVKTGATLGSATADGERLTGRFSCVMAAGAATRIVVPTADALWAVEPGTCTLESQTGTDDDELAIVTLEGVSAERLGGAEELAAWQARVEVGLCSVLLGLSQKALALTASYVKERHQFGRPVGMFQAVQQRIADAWIATEVMEVTHWQAAWRVSEGLASERERTIARYWASEGSHQVCAAAQHLHGGFGFDRDYELHRYFLCAKQHEFVLGGANGQLERLGGLLAAR